MSESVQSSGKHGRWLDDALARHPGDENETTDPNLWDLPGHDGIVSADDDRDPDRSALRSEIGKYVSLAEFPATAATLTATAERNQAPDEVLDELRSLDRGGPRFSTPRDVWRALGLNAPRRF